jgi:hypothetical protein
VGQVQRPGDGDDHHQVRKVSSSIPFRNIKNLTVTCF